MDFQHRVGSKFGGGGPADTLTAAMDRKQRQYQMGLEAFDIDKDPYVFRNHVGQWECKLCLTVHRTIADYIGHTQGKKHRESLKKRAAMELQKGAAGPQPAAEAMVAKQRTVRIGRPGYKVVKQRDPRSGQLSMLFEVAYPEIEEGLQPRHRFMSAFEQRVEPADKDFQYILFAAEPYETVAFKIPSMPVDSSPGRLLTHWEPASKTFTVQIVFRKAEDVEAEKARRAALKPARSTITHTTRVQ